MRQTSKTRRTIGIRGQLMGFLCFICLLLVGLFWFLSTQLLEPLYTTHIQKQLTEQADAIVARMDEAIGKGETLSYWAFGSRLYVNNTFFNALRRGRTYSRCPRLWRYSCGTCPDGPAAS